MTSPVSLTTLPDDPKTLKALQGFVSQLGVAACFSFSFSVPMDDIDRESRVRILHDEQTDAGPTNVTTAAPAWQNLLTITLALDPTVQYLVTAHGSLDMVSAGPTVETMDLRVAAAVDTAAAGALQSLRGTSPTDPQYVPFAVPAYLAAAQNAQSVVLTLDANQFATGGSAAVCSRIRLWAMAIPLDLVRAQQ